jgi:hypothetical protein
MAPRFKPATIKTQNNLLLKALGSRRRPDAAKRILNLGWGFRQRRDWRMDIADELRRRSAEYDEIPAPILDFLEAHRY